MMRDLRSNGALVIAKALVVALLFLAVFTFASFAQSTATAVDRSFSQRTDVDLYNLVDAFTSDPTAFSEYRKSPERLERLSRFYSELDRDSTLTLLSAFDQPLTVRHFDAGRAFDAGAGTELGARGEYDDESGRRVMDVKSLQINRKAFEFYGLHLEDGQTLDWDAVDYVAGSVPVVLGDAYRESYEVGDDIDGTLYFTDLHLRVAGFLEEGSSLFYKGDINHYLDDVMVVPYPAELTSLLKDDVYVGGIVAFAMVNADLAAAKDVDTDGVLAALESIASRTGFHEYTLTDIPGYLVQYGLVKRIVHDNFWLLTSIVLLLTLAALVLCVGVCLVLSRRRAASASAHWHAGRSFDQVARLFAPSLLADGVVTVVAFWLGYRILPYQSGLVVLVAGALLCWIALDAVVQVTTLRGEVAGRRGRGLRR
jgi:hypothetical protein